MPGLRVLDKWAVLMGGGANHRMGLYDMVMIKDNHVTEAGGITAAVARCQASAFSATARSCERQTDLGIRICLRLTPCGWFAIRSMSQYQKQATSIALAFKISIPAQPSETMFKTRHC